MENQQTLQVFLTKEKVHNMNIERIVLPEATVETVLSTFLLEKEHQVEAINKLVDRTSNWVNLEEEIQRQKIIDVLTQETMVHYLLAEGVIREDCDMYETGIDPERSIVIRAFYIEQNRETRRLLEKLPKSAQEENDKLINLLGGDNLIELAKKKMEKAHGKK